MASLHVTSKANIAMCKRTLILAGIFLFSIESNYLFAQVTNESSGMPLDRHQFRTILNALFIPYAPITNLEARTEWLRKNEERERAATQLRILGTNALPLLLEELESFDRIEETNTIEAKDRQVKIQAAFEVLGPEAKPLIPELVVDLKVGRNPGNAAQGLAEIGGNDAGLALVQAITNPVSVVRLSAASAITHFKDNREIATSAINPLLCCLADGSVVLRSVAVNALGTLEAKPDVVVPALLRVAETDPESILRAGAIQSIGRFGANAVSAETRLQTIAESDKSEDVRRMAIRVLQTIAKANSQ
jgi:HEAT repeat protein